VYFAKGLPGPTLPGLAFHGCHFLGNARGRRNIRAEARVMVGVRVSVED